MQRYGEVNGPPSPQEFPRLRLTHEVGVSMLPAAGLAGHSGRMQDDSIPNGG